MTDGAPSRRLGRSRHTAARPVLRREVADDAPATEACVAAAFAPSTAEVELVHALRADGDAWVGRYSIVAVDGDGTVVGHVLLTRVQVHTASLFAPALALAPLAVRPEVQGRGTGSDLVRRALVEARTAGETLVLVLGAPAFYRRLGFVPAGDLGIIGPVSGEAYQALALAPDHPVGDVRYPAAFAAALSTA